MWRIEVGIKVSLGIDSKGQPMYHVNKCEGSHKYRSTNKNVYMSLHHSVLLFLCSLGFPLVPFINAFDHYDEHNNCKKTRGRKRWPQGTKRRQCCHNIRLHNATELVLQTFRMCVRLTAESQNASQDSDSGSHSISKRFPNRCNIAVPQFCAVTHSHWYGE